MLVVWERLLLNKCARKCVARARHRRLQWVVRRWQNFGADASHAKRLAKSASAMRRCKLASAAWRRWMMMHGLEMRVRICRTAWRLRIMAEVFSSLAEELLCAHELYRKAASHRWRLLGKAVFYSWRRWCAFLISSLQLFLISGVDSFHRLILHGTAFDTGSCWRRKDASSGVSSVELAMESWQQLCFAPGVTVLRWHKRSGGKLKELR